jgi:hypothetical protein
MPPVSGDAVAVALTEPYVATLSDSVKQMASQAAALMAMRNQALTETFRYFVGFHSGASRCASAI